MNLDKIKTSKFLIADKPNLMMRRFIFVFLCINFYLMAYNQAIKGTILDEKTRNAVSFASVYLNGTFVGTTTDKDGNFELNISQHASLPLTISAIGYYSATLDEFPYDKPIIVYLTPKVYDLNEVVIHAKSYARKRKSNLKLFINEFLGRTANARDCEITNLNDITFNYNSDQDTLKAFALKPILINNKALGYKIIYFLDKFEYYKKSNSIFYKGSVLFKEDLEMDEIQKQIYDRKRKDAYLGSRMHFFRALWNGDLQSAGFKVKKIDNSNIELNDIVFQEDNLTKILKSKEILGICYHEGLPNTYIIFKAGHVSFDKNGYFDPSALSWQGTMAGQRMADCLPYEYSTDTAVKKQDHSTDDSLKNTEKVYLHFDRLSYSPGEDISFKAYVVNAGTNMFNASETFLHVELFNKDAKLIAKEVIQLTNGTGNGDFSLDEDLPGGVYYVRAYTNWMRNFGELFFFTREIEISNSNASAKSSKTVDDLGDHKIDLQFMPEGGNLIEDVLSAVGFKAVNRYGLGCDVKGFVISSENDTITAFSSAHLGMGTFPIIPRHGLSYFALGTTGDGIQFKIPLPSAKETGYSLHVTDVDDNYFKVVTRTNLAGLKNKTYRTMYLSCLSRNILCMSGKIPADTSINAIFIAKKNFPEGITCITLFNNELQPQCERLFYIHKKDGVHLALSSDKGEYGPEEKAGINIVLNDTDNYPGSASLSMSVTELNPREEQKYCSNICSYFLLESDIKGKIEQPGYYFDLEQVDRFSSMDLLLLTQGWRNFIWKQLPDSLGSMHYPIETGIPVSGRLRQTIMNKAIPGAVITLALIDSLKSPSLETTTTDAEGKFLFNLLTFNGSRRLILSAMDAKNRMHGLLQLDSLNIMAPANAASFSDKISNSISSIQKGSEKDSIPEQADMKPIRRKKFSIRDTLAIDQVVVHARKSLMPDDGRYRMYGLPAYVIESKDVRGYAGIDEFLEIASVGNGFKVGGFCPKGLGIAIHNCQTSIIGAPNRVVILLDGMEIPADYLCSLDPTDIEKIEVLTRSGSVIFGSGVCGVLSLFSKRGGETNKETPGYVVQKEIEGYYLSREFYCPVFNGKDIPDPRSETVFWEPNIITDASGKAQVSFYNKKQKGFIHVQVEGLTLDGVPISGSTNYLVK